MKNSLRTSVLLVLLHLVVSQHSVAQPTTKGTDFWMGFMENLDLAWNGAPRFSFFISSEYNATGEITLPATGFIQSFSVAAGNVIEVLLPVGIFYPIGSEYIDPNGFHITSDQPVSVRVHHQRLDHSEASIVLPTTELGSDYMAMCYRDNFCGGSTTSLIVVATEDNSVVDIIPTVQTRGMRPAGVSFSVTLNRGDIYQVQSYLDLTGSSVSSRGGKKIAVFTGARTSCVNCTNDNHLYDEAYPTSSWRNDYIAVPFSDTGDVFRVLAKENNTLVYFGCGAPVVLNRGENIDTNLTVAIRIRSSSPICIGQFHQGGTCSPIGDPNFINIPPLELMCTHERVMTMESILPYTEHYAIIIAQTANISQFTINGNTPLFNAIPQGPEYSYARVLLAVGTYEFISDSGFVAFAFGVKQFDMYSYTLGYNMRKPPISTLSFNASTPMCADSVITFTASGTSQSYGWNFGDGGSSSDQSVNHTFSNPGVYQVILLGDSSGCPQVATQTLSVVDCYDECDPFVPNVFSPNGDSHNDVICVQGSCLSTVHFRIYDRWGELIFESTDKTSCWDGSFRGRPLSAGVFVYQLSGTRTSGTSFEKSGNITLIR